MAKASAYLVAKWGGDVDVITVACQWGGDCIRIGGSSLPISAKLGASVNFFSVKVPERGKQGIVALSVEHTAGSGKNAKWFRVSYILPVFNPQKDEESPYIDMENIWVPPNADRLMQINHYGELEVKIGGIVYTTEKPQENSKTSDCYILDGNLLCKYVMGIVSAKEVKAHAESYVQETSAKKKLPKLVEENDSLHQENKRLWEAIEGMEKKLKAWKQATLNLKKAVSSLLFKGAAVKEALNGFPSES